MTSEQRAMEQQLIEAAGQLAVRGSGDKAGQLRQMCWRDVKALETGSECPVPPVAVLAQVNALLGGAT
jgi:hypothetical protein